MSEQKNPEDNSEFLKKTIDQIMVSSKITPIKRTPLKIKKKEQFCDMLLSLKYINDRALQMKAEMNVDFTQYEEPFFVALEALLSSSYNRKQRALIDWWLYEKWYHPEGVLIIKDEDSGLEIPTDSPEELFELVSNLK